MGRRIIVEQEVTAEVLEVYPVQGARGAARPGVDASGLVLGSSAGLALGSGMVGLMQSTANAAHNAVAAQLGQTTTAQAAVVRAVKSLYSPSLLVMSRSRKERK